MDNGYVYKRPPGKMDFNKTSDDYKQHGTQGKMTKRPRDNLEWMDQHFDGKTSYQEYKTHEGFMPEKAAARSREAFSSGVPFDAITESKDQFKKMNVVPSKPIRQDHQMIDKSAPFISDTSYDAHFQQKKLPECPSKAIVANNFAGYKFKDDFASGHRYLMQDSPRLGSPGNPLPPIGQQQQQQQSQRYVAVQ